MCVNLACLFRCLPKLWKLLLLLLPLLLLFGEFVGMHSAVSTGEAHLKYTDRANVITSTHPQSMLQLQHQIEVSLIFKASSSELLRSVIQFYSHILYTKNSLIYYFLNASVIYSLLTGPLIFYIYI